MKKMTIIMAFFIVSLIFVLLSNSAGKQNQTTSSNETDKVKTSNNSNTNAKETSQDKVLDAMQYWKSKSETISESEFIKLMGKPDSVEEWDFKGSYQVLVDKTNIYPIRSLFYGNYEYMFHNDMLQRISIDEDIPYNNSDDILEMFGLKKYSNTKTESKNTYFRAENCGVPDFWVQDMDEQNLKIIKISYGTFWNE